jgi:hypothetical protein
MNITQTQKHRNTMKWRMALLLFAVLTTYSAIAQSSIRATDSLFIVGKVKNPIVFTLADLDTFPKTPIKTLVRDIQTGETKDTLTGMSGIPIKTLLASVKYMYDAPKQLNEFYFVFIASDGYRVVFSWNELYTSNTGNNFFIVTEIDGKKLEDLEQRIFFIPNSDLERGNRKMKGLKTIEVRQIE